MPSQAPSIAIAGLLALAVAMGIGRFVYTPILPFMFEALDLSKAQAGLLASANFLGYLLGALGAAAPGLPGGRHRWCLGALLASAISTGAMGLTTAFPAFLVLRFIGGLASAFVLVFASALVLDRLAAAGRAGLSAVHFAGVGAGIAASAILVWALAASQYDWQALWLASGALSICAVAVVARLLPRDQAGGGPGSASAGGRLDGRLISLILAYGLFGFGYVITATFISTVVRSIPDSGSIESLVWLLVGLSAAPSVAFWAWVGRRWGNERSFAAACLVEAVGVALSVLAASGLLLLVSAFLLGGTFVGITAMGLVHARSLTSGDPRRILALMTAAFGLGQMIGPTFAGVLFDMSGSFLAPSLVAAAALVVAAALGSVPRHPP